MQKNKSPVLDRYHHHNRRKWNLKIHVVLVTRYRKKLLQGHLNNSLKLMTASLCENKGIKVITLETDRDHIHLLLEYDTTVSVAEIVKHIKQQTTINLWKQFPEYLKRHYWNRKTFWSDGYFACSIGEVSAETIERYIDNQG